MILSFSRCCNLSHSIGVSQLLLHLLLLFALVLNRQVELELSRKLLLGVEPVGEVDPSDSAICVNLKYLKLFLTNDNYYVNFLIW